MSKQKTQDENPPSQNDVSPGLHSARRERPGRDPVRLGPVGSGDVLGVTLSLPVPGPSEVSLVLPSYPSNICVHCDARNLV